MHFQVVTLANEGSNKASESEKRMTSATQAATNSSVNRADTTTRALGPNDTYARSEYVMRLTSYCMHFPNRFPV